LDVFVVFGLKTMKNSNRQMQQLNVYVENDSALGIFFKEDIVQ